MYFKHNVLLTHFTRFPKLSECSSEILKHQTNQGICLFVVISNPVGKINKNSLKECVFCWFGTQCHVVKNTLQQTACSAILPTGKNQILKYEKEFLKAQIFL